MRSATKVDPQAIADDFRTAMKGSLADEHIDAGVNTILSTTGTYPASLIFYPTLQVIIRRGETFTGNSPCGSNQGIVFGDVYTDDTARLYRDTVTFEFQATPVYISVLFFDKNSNLLGHFQATAVSVVTGVGAGSGKWSQA